MHCTHRGGRTCTGSLEYQNLQQETTLNPTIPHWNPTIARIVIYLILQFLQRTNIPWRHSYTTPRGNPIGRLCLVRSPSPASYHDGGGTSHRRHHGISHVLCGGQNMCWERPFLLAGAGARAFLSASCMNVEPWTRTWGGRLFVSSQLLQLR